MLRVALFGMLGHQSMVLSCHRLTCTYFGCTSRLEAYTWGRTLEDKACAVLLDLVIDFLTTLYPLLDLARLDLVFFALVKNDIKRGEITWKKHGREILESSAMFQRCHRSTVYTQLPQWSPHVAQPHSTYRPLAGTRVIYPVVRCIDPWCDWLRRPSCPCISQDFGCV